jgi:hypothetical protein
MLDAIIEVNQKPLRRAMKKQLTQKRLKEVLRYYPGSGIFRWKTTGKGRKRKIAGCKRPDGYILIRIDGQLHFAHRLAFLYVHGYFPENQIDHIDRNRSNNKIKNLREISQQCNSRNTGNPIDNTSGVKGVCWYEKYNKWMVRICANGKRRHLGYYKNFDDAVMSRYEAEKELNWKGCNDSSPAYQYLKENNLLKN